MTVARLLCILGCAGVAAAFVPSFIVPAASRLAPSVGRNSVGVLSPRGVVRTAAMVAGTGGGDAGGRGARGLAEWFGGLLQQKERAESDQGGQQQRRQECKGRLGAAVALNQGSANRQLVCAPTLESTQGQITSKSPTDATRFWWHWYWS